MLLGGRLLPLLTGERASSVSSPLPLSCSVPDELLSSLLAVLGLAGAACPPALRRPRPPAGLALGMPAAFGRPALSAYREPGQKGGQVTVNRTV